MKKTGRSLASWRCSKSDAGCLDWIFRASTSLFTAPSAPRLASPISGCLEAAPAIEFVLRQLFIDALVVGTIAPAHLREAVSVAGKIVV